jgi:bacterioferritin-associated ferredoxin
MIVCSCNVRTDAELKAEARKGTLWREAVQQLPVSNKCGHCKHLTKPMYAEARKEAGFPPEPEKRHTTSLPAADGHTADKKK